MAGWAYQIVAELGFERDSSWVAPVDAKRVKPTQNTDEAAAEQLRALMQRLPEPQALPIFVFEASSTIRLSSSAAWKDAPRGYSGQVALQQGLLRRTRAFFPATGGPSAPPRREVRPQRPRELAAAFIRTALPKRRLRLGEG